MASEAGAQAEVRRCCLPRSLFCDDETARDLVFKIDQIDTSNLIAPVLVGQCKTFSLKETTRIERDVFEKPVLLTLR